MSRGSISPDFEGEPPRLDGACEGLRHLHRIAGLGDGSVEQHRVIAHLHRLCRVRGRADPGVDDERRVGKISAERLERIFVDEAAR